MIIKQTAPQGDSDSAVFEIFNRLNTGGVNLSAQEIRASLYQSDFMLMLDSSTFSPQWLYFTGKKQPDINLKDTEILLRAFAMLANGIEYREPMGTFINGFAKKARAFSAEETEYARSLIATFLKSLSKFPKQIFSVTNRPRFNIAFFESVFRAMCEVAFRDKILDMPAVTQNQFDQLRDDKVFVSATRFSTGQVVNVKNRFERAREILLS